MSLAVLPCSCVILVDESLPWDLCLDIFFWLQRTQMWLAKFTFFPILKSLCAEKEVQLERPSFFSQIQEFDY